VFGIRWYKNEIARREGDPFSALIDFTVACMNENFMLPGVLMFGGIAPFLDFEKAHTKIVGTIFAADQDSAHNAFHAAVIHPYGGNFRPVHDFHYSTSHHQCIGKTVDLLVQLSAHAFVVNLELEMDRIRVDTETENECFQ
jgi:hypothetical protein